MSHTNNGYTATQVRMLEILKDGRRHSYEELHGCLGDELAPVTAIFNHLSRMRPHLQAKGQDVICEFFERKRWYRHIVLLPSANDGRT